MIPVQQVWEYYGFSANWGTPPFPADCHIVIISQKSLNGNFGRYTQFSDTHVKFPASGCKVTLSTPTWSTVSDLITKKPINTPFLINDWVYSHFSSRKCVLFLEKKLELAQGFDSCGRPNGPVWPGWSDSLSCNPLTRPFLINDWVYSHFSSRKCVLFLEKKLELAQGFDSCGRPNGPVWPGWSDSLSCKGCEQQDGLNTKKWDSKQQKLGGLPIESGDSFTELSQLKNHRRC